MTPKHDGGDNGDDFLEFFSQAQPTTQPAPQRAKTPRHPVAKRKRGKGRRIFTVLLVIVLLLGGLGVAGSMLWNQFGDKISEMLGWTTNDFEGEGHGEAMITIEAGEIGEDIAHSLFDAGVVKTTQAFYELLLAQEPAVAFHPGSYRLKLEMSAQSALDALRDPANRMQLSAMVPEGKTVNQVLEIIAAGTDIPLADLQAAAADPSQFGLPEGVTSLEGWLYAATYEYEPNTSAVAALQEMVDLQAAMLDGFGVAIADRERVLTIASIVEREAGQHADFGKVATVIFNRLSLGMRLQMDSTAQYGMGQHADGSVWSSDEALRDDNPWNTYVIDGLPIGPIANPGRAAVEAVLHPEPGDWIFFVAVNLDTGESVFTTNIADHNVAVRQLNEWCQANPGKGC